MWIVLLFVGGRLHSFHCLAVVALPITMTEPPTESTVMLPPQRIFQCADWLYVQANMKGTWLRAFASQNDQYVRFQAMNHQHWDTVGVITGESFEDNGRDYHFQREVTTDGAVTSRKTFLVDHFMSIRREVLWRSGIPDHPGMQTERSGTRDRSSNRADKAEAAQTGEGVPDKQRGYRRGGRGRGRQTGEREPRTAPPGERNGTTAGSRIGKPRTTTTGPAQPPRPSPWKTPEKAELVPFIIEAK